MRYTLAAAAIAGAVSAGWSHGGDNWGHGGDAGSWGPPPSNGTGEVWVTEVVTAFTTYCPEATVITQGSSTWSASASQTLTITGPVTITKPVYTSVITSCTTCSTAPVTTAPVTASVSKPAPPMMSSGVAPKPSASASMSKKPAMSGTAPGTAVGTGSMTSTAPMATYTGAASHLQAGAAGALAIFGLVAAL